MYRVFLKLSAEKALKKLPPKIRMRIVNAIEELARYGIQAPNTKKLQASIGGYRMRIGEYRILFDRDAEFIVVHNISIRADAYR